MIEAIKVAKTFGLRPVLRGVDMTVAPGEFVALFGPNGAGKTTFLRIVASLSKPTAGLIRIAGYQLPTEAATVRGLLGVVSHAPLIYGDLSAAENLHFYARMYGLDRAAREDRITAVLEMVGLGRRAGDLARTFSRGMQQRLAIARAILHDPPVLLLDEPYTGLDQDAAAVLDRVLREVAVRGRTVLMTTHDITRGLALADRALILSGGKIAYDAPTAGLEPVAFARSYAEVTGMATVR
ncbi:MAG: ABC transporter ATP-binding protein [Anaerolineae bacterium]